MTKVSKANDKTEDFSRDKIMRSLQHTGVPEATAKQVAAEVEERLKSEDSVDTGRIRTAVSESLKKRDSKMATRYENTRLVKARKASKAVRGTVMVDNLTLNRLNINSGDTLEVRHADHSLRLRAELGQPQPRTVELSEDDLRTLDVKEGQRIEVLHPF